MPIYDCTLRDYVLEKDHLTFEQKVIILQEVCSGLCFLHANRVIHRDLHVKNVLIRNQQKAEGIQVSISDLGMCRKLPKDMDVEDKSDYAMSFGENTLVMSQICPNEVEWDNKCGYRSDVYAFGFLMWQVMYGLHSSVTNDEDQDWHTWVMSQIRQIEQPPLDEKQPPLDEKHINFNAIMKECLDPEYDKRPTSKDLLKRLNGLTPERTFIRAALHTESPMKLPDCRTS
jgi:serine/threonine protein kinase